MTLRALLGAALFTAVLMIQGQSALASDTVIQRFGTAPDGMGPFSPLVADASGNLYGAAERGGKYGQGVVYELSPPTATVSTWTKSTIYSFPPSRGIGKPQGSLVTGPNGILYGTAASANGCTLFQLSPPAAGAIEWQETDSYNFNGQNSSDCAGLVIGRSGGTLYGTLPESNTASNGAVFTLTPPALGSTTWIMTTIYKPGDCAKSPTGSIENLLLGPGGAFYGRTYSCGKFGFGFVFKLTPPSIGQTAWIESDIYDFIDNTSDFSPLVIAENGVIYGTGSDNPIAALTPPASGQTLWTLNNIYTTQIKGVDLSQILSLNVGAGGSLYGLATSREAYGSGFGFAFRLSPPAKGQTLWRWTALYSFTGADGSCFTNLIKGYSGLLYGVACSGGPSGYGTVFSLGPPSSPEAEWIETPLYNFAGVASVSPTATLTGDGTGALYGFGSLATIYGGDVDDGSSESAAVFKLTPPSQGQSAWAYEQLTQLDVPSVWGVPQAPLIKGSDGMLYGAYRGTVFTLTPPTAGAATWTRTDIPLYLDKYSYQPFSGQVTSLVEGPDGTLYGATAPDDTASYIFMVSPPSHENNFQWTGSAIFEFGNTSFYNNYFVTIGSDGTLYVVSSLISNEMTSNAGNIFKLTPPAKKNGQYWTQTILYSFLGGADGAQPNGPLIVGPDGMLYGTTMYGGDAPSGSTDPFSGDGTVFALKRPTAGQTAWTETVLYRFTGGLDGSVPESTLLRGKDGTLYGITSFGGEDVIEGASAGKGTVYKLTPPKSAAGTWTHSVLHRFVGGRDGSIPLGGLVLNTDGQLYGTTAAGGGAGYTSLFYQLNIANESEGLTFTGTGTVFQITP